MMAYVLASETLRLVNRRAERTVFTWETRSVVAGPAKASNGREVVPDVIGWGDTVRPELVMLIAGYEPLAARPAGLRAYLSRAARGGAMLGCLDTGALLLATFGMVPAGTRLVVHPEARPAFRESFPDLVCAEGHYAQDERFLSAAGGTATCDAILEWVAGRVSREIATQVAEDMAHGSIRPAEPRAGTLADTSISAMHNHMAQNIETPCTIAEIAARVGLSGKALRGRCLRRTGRTPSAYYVEMRLSCARDLLISTAMPVSEIALATGFGSAAGFSRTFRSRYAASPRDVRQGSTLSPQT